VVVLAFFKYGAFFYAVATGGDQSSMFYRFLVAVPLPIGISFYTFEGISLIVDVFHSRAEPWAATPGSYWRHLQNTALFVSFFPHLVSGPILKARHFYPQIGPKDFARIPWNRVFCEVVTGFFLKAVIADNLKDLTFYMDASRFGAQPGVHLLALLPAYSVQIFSDFAGYSLIAIGVAQLYGYELPVNFNFPYVATSVADFWKRWHMSLSQWLRDYLYFPLGGSRAGRGRTYLNLFLVMGIGGLWHGASSSYLFWGVYHGVLLAVERALADVGLHLPSRGIFGVCRVLGVFALVTAGWLLFKLPAFGQVLGYIGTIARNWAIPARPAFLFSIVLFCLPVGLWHLWSIWGPRLAEPRRSLIAALAYGAMLFALVFNSGTPGRFIYFQF
jgi:alginate O-acetyltransferase complex protein AlgI